MKKTESSALLSKREYDCVPVTITQALPRLSDPVLKEVRKAERANHTQKQQQRVHQPSLDHRRRFRVINVNEIPPQQPHQHLNPSSHHVRTTEAKKTSSQFARDEFNVLEERLISSIQINEALENDINRNIAIAYQRQSLRVPIIAFMKLGTEVRFIRDFARLVREEYDVVHTKNPGIISKEQLSLDLLHNEKEYRTIISVILYMESLRPPLAYIISRYPVTFTPRVPDLFIDEEGDSESVVTTTVTTSATTTTTTTTRRPVTSSPPSDNNSLILSTPTSNDCISIVRVYHNLVTIILFMSICHS
mgnify:CR=1 FL=1